MDARENRSKVARRVKDIKKVKPDFTKPTKRYRKEQRTLLREKTPDIKSHELLRLIERSWSQLTKPQKMKYVDAEPTGKPSRKPPPTEGKKRSKDKPSDSDAKLHS